ncbi:helix-turn-helix domain-containing protein [Vibrio sonorensis]|uniref:helix-turn-helix domain-containing protein n=1 Tax=Vibrio sonorensis TaxID=1004316 RepID=UPI0008D96ED0|nr:AraC family transcriptional regulator [Vibrio sonorensis]
MEKWILYPTDKMVKEHVSQLYFIRKKDGSENGEIMRLLPQCSSYAIFTESDSFFSYSGKNKYLKNLSNHFLYPLEDSMEVKFTLPINLLAIRFKPGLVYNIWGAESANYKNSVLPIEVLDKNKFDSLHKVCLDIFECQPNEKNIKKLEKSIKEFLQWSIKEEPKSKLVRRSLEKLESRSISSVCSEIGCSRRTLERHFKGVTGFTMNQYKDIQILHKIVDELRSGKEVNWTELAQNYGFFDQSHLIKHFKKMLGVTPTEFLEHTEEFEVKLFSDTSLSDSNR